MKFFKSFLAFITICFILFLSTQALRLYYDVWMIFSYICHIIILIVSLFLYGICYNKDSAYSLGWHLCVIIILMISSLYPFFFMSSIFTDILSFCFDKHFKIYEGGVLVSIGVLAVEFILLAFFINCISDIRQQVKSIQNKTLFIVGIFLPIILFSGYMSIPYINHTIKKNQAAKVYKEKKELNDSINNILAQQQIELSFSKYKLGDIYTESTNAKPESLFGEKTENITLKEHNGIIYKIIVTFKVYNSKFRTKVIDLYTKKYGNTGTSGEWNFKNGSIKITESIIFKHSRSYDRMIKMGRYADAIPPGIDYYIVKITYTDHDLESTAKKKQTLEKEQQQRKMKEDIGEKKKMKEIEEAQKRQQEFEMI